MGTVTQYNLANVRDALGGGNPVYMSNYYRGGPYVPANRTINYTAREPASGSYFQFSVYSWEFPSKSDGNTRVRWGGSVVFAAGGYYTSVTVGSITYYSAGGTSGVVGVYRTYPASYQQAINTGVPSSGAISISQLYGAANP